MKNPYIGISDYCFWSKAMTSPAPGHIDPVTKFVSINPQDKIATMGSCFAQHLSRHILSSGFNYFVSETSPEGLSPEDSAKKNYGVFSARYGNVYTVRQALQLFDRAFGSFKPVDAVWKKGSKFVDAFRPQIEVDGFNSAEEVAAETLRHLDSVKKMFLEADWLVLTLGLTEGWRSRVDGAMYPIAPGVAGGEFNPDNYEFVNFTASEVRDDLYALTEKLLAVNSKLKILLTVSPVPLIATYEDRHVLVSTTYSKSALRVAADEAERRFRNIIYFPSYEIITSPASGGRYYKDDLREVTELGVKHVMRIFGNKFLNNQVVTGDIKIENNLVDTSPVVCDEETIEAALRDFQASVK